jgi:hypothetical protein
MLPMRLHHVQCELGGPHGTIQKHPVCGTNSQPQHLVVPACGHTACCGAHRTARQQAHVRYRPRSPKNIIDLTADQGPEQRLGSSASAIVVAGVWQQMLQLLAAGIKGTTRATAARAATSCPAARRRRPRRRSRERFALGRCRRRHAHRQSRRGRLQRRPRHGHAPPISPQARRTRGTEPSARRGLFQTTTTGTQELRIARRQRRRANSEA